MSRRLAKQLASAFALLPLLAWLFSVLIAGNFGVVDPGELYRSAQLRPSQLAQVTQEYGLRAVLNLRGAYPGVPWYDEELATASALGVQHLDLRFSATEEASLAEMDALVDALRRAPKPLLVHCMGGADRTGLAVALYRYAVQGEASELAKTGLSAWYGHLPYLGSRTGAMDRSFARYVAARPRGGRGGSPARAPAGTSATPKAV